MEITHFDDLLRAARAQPDAQRLLLVFAAASLPAGASAEQRARFEAGEAGELAPVMCVDKDPHDLASFGALAAEAAQQHTGWVLVFAAALGGEGRQPPTAVRVDAALNQMVEAVKLGDIGRFVPFDCEGHAVQLG
jgi:hypothetical protein